MLKPILGLVMTCAFAGQTPQNPSPMVEHTRRHARLPESRPPGTRIALKIGTLFLPKRLPSSAPLFLHFHGGEWIPETAAARIGAAVITAQLGSGSTAYARPLADPQSFGELIGEAEEKSGRAFSRIGLTAWSAGYGAIREILRGSAETDRRLEFVLLLDGLHCGYVGGRPGPGESALAAEDLEVFVRLARNAASGHKRFVLTHSEIFPGTFASTTETADYLLRALGIKRKAVLRWGPMGTQMLSDSGRGGFRVLGFAGNSAPDHVDLLHALPDLLRQEWGRTSAPPR